MIGISKEKLANINPWVFETQQDLLNFILDSCKELDPWLPIEDAPKDRMILLIAMYDTQKIFSGNWDEHWRCWIDSEGNPKVATHYKELPEDPKD